MGWLLALLSLGVPLLTGRFSDRYYEGVTHGGAAVGVIWLAVALVDKLKNVIPELLAVLVVGYVAVVGAQNRIETRLEPAKSQPDARRPLFPRRDAPTVGAFVESPDGVGPGGAEVVTDLPKELRKRNISSRGLGCCVFRSGEFAGDYQNIPAVNDWAEWMVKNGIEGGGYPAKVDQLLKKVCADRGVPVPDYVQHEGGDPKFLEAALAGGRMVCVTYDGRDNRYRSSIAHMVNLVYLDDKYACILDNNFIDAYLWMSRDEFISRWKGTGGGWAYAFLGPPPPPPPSN